MSHSSRLGGLSLGLALASGCNPVDFMQIGGYSQESFNNDADLLFVIDNSCSMTEESAGLATHFSRFIQQLTNAESGQQTENLSDAVQNYLDTVGQADRYVNFRIGITSTNVEVDYGKLLGAQPLIDNGDSNIAAQFNENLLCHTACLDPSVIPSDPTYECGQDFNEVSVQVLNCVCGENEWQNQCTTGDERGLEAVLMAMCRAAPEPIPSACFESPSQFNEADILSNEGLLREGSTLVPIIISDEGDQSAHLQNGDADIQRYLDFYAQFNHRMVFTVIGPSPDFPDCAAQAANWGVARYQAIVDETRGRYIPLSADDGTGCKDTNFSENLDQIGQLLNRLLDAFPLQTVPDEASIRVFVEGDAVGRAEPTEGGWTDGWHFDPAQNAVVFTGDSVPGYNEHVEIYYRPLSGMPRELPL